MITFITEDRSIFAIEQNIVKNGKFYDELFYAEITDFNTVIWQDNWKEILEFKTLEEAKQHILDNYTKHTPHKNGGEYDID